MKYSVWHTGIVMATMLFLCTAVSTQAQDVWEPLDTGTTQDLHAAHFLSDDLGYVIGAGVVLKTTDGGTTWDDVSPDVTQDFRGVHFFDAETGVVVGSNGTIVRTEDGGATWTAVPSPTSDALYGVSFGSDVGLAGGGSQTILRSEDQGATWTEVQGGFFGGGFFGADMVDDSHGVLVGANSIFQPLVAVTSDGGASFGFTPFYLNTNEGQLSGVRFLDEQEGVAVGRTFDFRGAISRTEDGGQTWTTTLSDDALYGVDFASAGDASAPTGYAVGEAGTIWKTTDGGLTWAQEQSGTTDALVAVSVPTATTAYAVGAGGMVLRGTAPQPTPLSDDPTAPHFALEQNFPNPVTARTTIRYRLSESTHVTLRVYDALGREVALLVDGVRGAGPHEAILDAAPLSPGLYVYVMEAGPFQSTRSMLLLK